MNKLSLVLLLLIPSLSFANLFAQWGIPSAYPSENKASLKFVEFGRSGEVGRCAYTLGIGGWNDDSGYTTTVNHYTYKAHSSAYVETLFGVEPKSEHFYMNYKLGPAIITDTDALLGSNVELSHEFGFGMRDVRDLRIGFVLKHFSNAGLVKPNKGRDWAGMRMEW